MEACSVYLQLNSVITEQQCEDLKRARYAKVVWFAVANNIRKSTQKYQKFIDGLEYFEISRVLSMLETKFGKIALITFNIFLSLCHQ